MLEPEWYEYKADVMLDIYYRLEDYILKDIARRILSAGEMTGTADRLIWKLEQVGLHKEKILAELSKLTAMSKEELRTLLQDAVMTSWKDDLSTFDALGIETTPPLENPVVRQIMDAEWKKANEELDNLTRTTMDKSQQDLIKMLSDVEVKVSSGVMTYSTAAEKVIDDYAGQGLIVEYPTGARRTLESAVRMCVVTSMNQTSAQITNEYIKEGEIEYVLTSAHLGARVARVGSPPCADHSEWQGKVFKIDGEEEGYPNLLDATGYDIKDGVGTVVNPLGLHGYNCRHGHRPFDKRLRNPYIDKDGKPTIDKEENRKMYELTQKQRAMERAIRKLRRMIVGQTEVVEKYPDDMNAKATFDKLSYKLENANKKYNDFCKENNLAPQYDRLKTALFNRANVEQVAEGAINYKKSLKDN